MNCRIHFPTVKYVRKENQRHRPDLVEYKHGVRASLIQCLSLTISERIQNMDLVGMDTESLAVKFSFNWGLDGSGDHSNYHQLTKRDFTTKQVMSVCFSVREISILDTKGMKVRSLAART